jgi:circadian clock protein KaiB
MELGRKGGRDSRGGGVVLEQGTRKSERPRYVLRLYIAGVSLRSSHAVGNIKKICEEHLKGRYELEVIDIYQHPDLAKSEQVIAVPTLIKKLPPPLRKFIGDLADTETVLVGLELQAKPGTPD